jgi:hypothetical protein
VSIAELVLVVRCESVEERSQASKWWAQGEMHHYSEALIDEPDVGPLYLFPSAGRSAASFFKDYQ